MHNEISDFDRFYVISLLDRRARTNRIRIKYWPTEGMAGQLQHSTELSHDPRRRTNRKTQHNRLQPVWQSPKCSVYGWLNSLCQRHWQTRLQWVKFLYIILSYLRKTHILQCLITGSYTNGKAVKMLSGHSWVLKLYSCNFDDLYRW